MAVSKSRSIITLFCIPASLTAEECDQFFNVYQPNKKDLCLGIILIYIFLLLSGVEHRLYSFFYEMHLYGLSPFFFELLFFSSWFLSTLYISGRKPFCVMSCSYFLFVIDILTLLITLFYFILFYFILFYLLSWPCRRFFCFVLISSKLVIFSRFWIFSLRESLLTRW